MHNKLSQVFTSLKQNIVSFFSKDTGKSAIIAVTWQFIMTIIGAFFDITTRRLFQNPHAGDDKMSLLSHTMHWDANWYMGIINGNYFNPENASAVFYPLFPMLVNAINKLSFGLIGYASAGLIINTVCLAIAIFALKKIAEHFLSTKNTWWPVLLFLSSPVAIFMHLFYTEAIFCALGFLSYYFALERKWWKMGIALGLLTATRLPAILFIGLAALEFMRAHAWSVKRMFRKEALAFLIAPLGFVLYGLFLLTARGDFFSMLNSYQFTDDWAYHTFNINIFQTFGNTIGQLAETVTTAVPFDEGQAINKLIPISLLLLLLISSIYLLITFNKKQLGLPLAIFGIVSIIFFSLNSNLISVHRYVLPCFGIYLFIAHLATKKPRLKILLPASIYVGVLLQAYLLIFFVNTHFAG